MAATSPSAAELKRKLTRLGVEMRTDGWWWYAVGPVVYGEMGPYTTKIEAMRGACDLVVELYEPSEIEELERSAE